MVLDGKPCLIVPYRSREDVGKQALSAGCGPDSGRVDLRARVNEFVNRYELPKDLRELFTKCKAESAARAVSKLEARALDGQTPAKIAEIVKAELIDAKRHELPQCVQLKADRWVAKLSIDPTSKRQVMDYFHDRSAEEVEYVVDEEGDYFERGLPRQRDPVQWLSGEVKKHMQRKVQKLADDFCYKFRLDEDMVDRLNKLNEIGQRNVMKKWECAGNRWDVEQRLRALLEDEERFKHRQQSKPWPSKATVADKQRIEEDSSSSEDEKDITTKGGMADKLVLETIRKTAKQSPKTPSVKDRSNEVAFVRSQDWLRKSRQEKRIQAYEDGDGEEGRGDKRRKKPRPTHYIICVDASGSMMLDDCSSAAGETVTRLDAVMEQCRSFMKESSLNSDDVYSFLTFNEEYEMHFTGLPMQEAQSRLRNSKPKAEKQTLYSQGLEGVRRAIKQESSGKPALVIFFSDGEPTDDGAFMQVLNKIKNKFDSLGMKFYTAGCGKGEKFEHLQQMANISGGAFNNCGVSTTSIRNAFSAISSSISISRESEQKSMEDWKMKTSCRATGTLEQIQEDAPQSYIDKINFEDPRPAEIYKDPGNLRCWDKISATQAVYIFDGRQFSRKGFQPDIELYLRKMPFMKGGMRVVYGMTEKQDPTAKQVAKRLFRDHVGTSEVEEHHVFAKSSAVAAYYAQMFQVEMNSKGLRPKVDFKFSEVGVYSKHLANPQVDEPFHFCGEKYLSGTWVKFNNNDGYVSEDLSKHSAVAQAFSHFTFERSGHRLMVVDLQGVCEERNSELVFRLTDPQVHSSRKWKRQSESFPERFGKGDFGEDGFSAFFQNYVYNKLSKDLGLRDELDVREPTETAYIPAVREYFEEFKTWLSHAREQLEWDLNEYCGPQEFDDNAYWFPVKIWAKKTNAQQALQDIQDKVEAVLAKRLRKLPVAQTGDEDGSKWEDKMSEWRQRFAATTLPWPPGFPRSPLKEVWVVADQAAEQEDITALHEEIEQALAEVSGSAAGGEASAWQKWFDENHQDWYFWNDISYDAFWPQEGHSGDWSWHIVGGNRKEWVNKAAGKSFFEDTAVDKRPVNKQS